jgi:predicted metal-dependent phosphoesterase TrpH
MRIDFHVHTSAGGARNTPAEMAAVAKKRGLDAIAITDATTKGWENFRPQSFMVIPGALVATDRGDLLVYGLQELPGSLVFDEVVKWAKDNGYLAVPAHFNDPKRNSLGDGALEFKVVEAINGTSPPWVCKDAVKKCTSAGVKFMCNSGARSVGGIGKFYNNVSVDTDDWERVLKAVKKGNFEPRIKFPGVRDFLGSKLGGVFS